MCMHVCAWYGKYYAFAHEFTESKQFERARGKKMERKTLLDDMMEENTKNSHFSLIMSFLLISLLLALLPYFLLFAILSMYGAHKYGLISFYAIAIGWGPYIFHLPSYSPFFSLCLLFHFPLTQNFIRRIYNHFTCERF